MKLLAAGASRRVRNDEDFAGVSAGKQELAGRLGSEVGRSQEKRASQASNQREVGTSRVGLPSGLSVADKSNSGFWGRLVLQGIHILGRICGPVVFCKRFDD